MIIISDLKHLDVAIEASKIFGGANTVIEQSNTNQVIQSELVTEIFTLIYSY